MSQSLRLSKIGKLAVRPFSKFVRIKALKNSAGTDLVAAMWPAYDQHVVSMLPILCKHVASMLRACCQHIESMLQAC